MIRAASLLLAPGLALALAGAAAAADDPKPAPGEPDLAAVRASAEKYRDVNQALADGYVRDPMNTCETAQMMGLPGEQGAMGVHYFRPDLLGVTAPPNPRVSGTGTHTDFLKPGVLIYEPQADGTLALVALENLVFEKAWTAAGHKTPPSFHGVAYEHMVDDPKTPVDEAHMFEPHYDKHVWIWRENPNGVFAPFNPKVTCFHHGAQAKAVPTAEAAPAVTPEQAAVHKAMGH
ncbi:hypothetical protein [Caulobacter sp. 17J80-11]|uniref:hypothetical protein n=1 Tax=Caulobacter sp. 17J80-11 TaxID=2763502 RepID=UPI001653B3DE|nr:hypothetical protein [Caulobacter sp. 17J80-11]MBC6982188.1 hypothetical protein [Caulobacter sp. 17J80-11]